MFPSTSRRYSQTGLLALKSSTIKISLLLKLYRSYSESLGFAPDSVGDAYTFITERVILVFRVTVTKSLEIIFTVKFISSFEISVPTLGFRGTIII